MRRNHFRKVFAGLAVLLCSVLFVQTAKAQIDDTGKLIQAGLNDANLLIKEYLRPAGNGFGAGLNSGWFNSASTHSVLGFDVTFRLNAAIVPGSDKSFDLAAMSFEKITLSDPSRSVTPTMSGSNQVGPEVVINETVNVFGTQQTLELARFTMPEGSGFGYVPTPMIQAAVGLPFGSEISLRFLPSYTIDQYGSFSLWGLGAKHNMNQWLPAGSFLPFDISVMAGYTSFKSSSAYEVTPGSDTYESDPNNYDRPATWEGQRIDLNTSAYTVNAIIGKSLPVISFYGGVGFESSTMTIRTLGNYPVITPEQIAGFYTGNRELDIVTDPLNIDYKGSNSFRALAGFRLKLMILTLSADYTMADYSMASVGVGFSFR